MKNSKQLCREIARELQLPEKDVSEQYMFIMNQLKNALIGMRGPVMLYKVGSFNIHYKKLRKVILYTIRKVRFYGPEGKCHMKDPKRQIIRDNYTQTLQRLLAERNRQAIHWVIVREHYAQRKIKKMAKQAADVANGHPPRKHWDNSELIANAGHLYSKAFNIPLDKPKA
jgi:nucleoid DNA-binding protein